ncbi:solute carrier family 35 member G1-like isoform X2 [Limulus polyphemus]|nr:solute carrier family 35 member G1-like isoform X2 [Limulus polyphemus]XP_022253482.1 solute carrier family 35 member G1-like isoform X2 [Limulus polyphemus]
MESHKNRIQQSVEQPTKEATSFPLKSEKHLESHLVKKSSDLELSEISHSEGVEENTEVEKFEKKTLSTIYEEEISSTTILDLLKKIPTLGYLMSLLSAFFFGISRFLIKFISDLNPTEKVVITATIQVGLCLPIVIYFRHSFLGKKGERLMFMFKIICGALENIMVFYSLFFISLSESSTIILGAPVLITVSACIFLGEKCGLLEIIGLVLAISGVLFVSNPPFLLTERSEFTSDRLVGILISLSACCFLTGAYVFQRKCLRTSFATIIFAQSLVVVFAGSIFHLSTQKLRIVPKCGIQSILIILCGVFNMLAMWACVLALQLENAGPVSIIRSFEIAFSFIFGICVLGEKPEWQGILGALLVFSSIILLGAKKLERERPGRFKDIFKKCI